MFYWLENSIRRLRHRISPTERSLRLLNLPVVAHAETQPGLLLVQIDGFPRSELERAIAKGRLPFLRSLLKRQHYKLKTFYSGVPAATPAVQGELFYNVPCVVPAFSFLDRETQRVATMYKTDWAQKIEARLQEQSAGEEPLLSGGSSWSNIYRGGATREESHFCAANIGLDGLFSRASARGILGFLLLRLPSLLRMFALVLLEFLLASWDLVAGVCRGQNFGKEFRFLVSRVAICIGLREVVTLGAQLDLARGLPIIHVNFLGYDEQSHCRGPSSAFAHWSLRGIDKSIRKLYRAAQRSRRRDYQVWVFSDHGQEPARSYAESFPGGIEQAIARGLHALQRVSRQTPVRSQQRASRAYWSGGRRARIQFEKTSRDEFLSREERESFCVTAMGPVGNVYFADPLDDSEKHQLARWLIREASVPGVLLKQTDGALLWLHPGGAWRVPDDDAQFLAQPEPLRREVARDLVRLCDNAFSGDLILVGWQQQSPSWTFPFERGSHGGPGLNETQGFALLPPSTRLPSDCKEFIRPAHLRAAALHFLKRKPLGAQTRPAPAAARPLRVMTYNVHGCLGLDGKLSPDRIAKVVETFHPDVVALQEVDLGRLRSHRHDQARMIAEALDMHAVFCPVVARGEELYGHALLTRLPVKILRSGVFACCAHLPGCEPRGALLAEVQCNGLPVYFLTTHLGVGPAERSAQMANFLGKQWLGSLDLASPMVVCGDFNMMRGTVAYRALAARLHDAQLACPNARPRMTFPAAFPFSRIDHVFVSAHFKVHHVSVPRNDLTRLASDHLPLIADLAVSGPPHRHALAPSGQSPASQTGLLVPAPRP